MSVQEREAFVAAAMSYVGTPYHHMGRVKGAGVDCATLLVCAAEDAGIVKGVVLEYYPPDWHLHNGCERYLATIRSYVKEVDRAPLPGDIMLWRFGRSFSHAAIVVNWPTIVHAYVGSVVRTDDAETAQWLTTIGESDPAQGKVRPRKLLSLWGD